MNYTVSRPSFNTFADVLGKERAEAFISEFEQNINEQRSALEQSINEQRSALEQQLAHNQTQLKAVVKEELRSELITRDLFETRFKSMEHLIDQRFKTMDERFNTIDQRFKTVDERFKTIDQRFKQQDFKLNVLIALAFVALTFANPTFVELVKHAIK